MSDGKKWTGDGSEERASRTHPEPKHSLRRRHNQRLPVTPRHLPPQQVEVLCRRREVDDVKVRDERLATERLVGELEEALEAGSGGERRGGDKYRRRVTIRENSRGRKRRVLTYDECSGPAPSIPCGKSNVKLL